MPRKTRPKYVKESFAKCIRLILKHEDYNACELAAALKVTDSCIYRWLNLKTEPTFLMILKVVKKYPYVGKYVGIDGKKIPDDVKELPPGFHGMSG